MHYLVKQPEMNVESAEQYVRAVFDNIFHAKGKESLLEWMETNGFFEAPASVKYHLNHDGGLLLHSVNVCTAILSIADEDCQYSTEQLLMAALLHDVCKCDMYRKKNGVWDYEQANMWPMGHGEKSVIQIMRHIPDLDPDVALAIRWHMGAFDDAAKGGSWDLGKAYNKCKLASMLHIADMIASYLME